MICSHFIKGKSIKKRQKIQMIECEIFMQMCTNIMTRQVNCALLPHRVCRYFHVDKILQLIVQSRHKFSTWKTNEKKVVLVVLNYYNTLGSIFQEIEKNACFCYISLFVHNNNFNISKSSWCVLHPFYAFQHA